MQRTQRNLNTLENEKNTVHWEKMLADRGRDITINIMGSWRHSGKDHDGDKHLSTFNFIENMT